MLRRHGTDCSSSGRSRKAEAPARAGAVVVVVALVGLAACSAPTQPEASVTCRPGAIAITVKNVSSKPATYTIGVDIDRAGFVEHEKYSSTVVQPGQEQIVRDIRPDDDETCKITKVEVFE